MHRDSPRANDRLTSCSTRPTSRSTEVARDRGDERFVGSCMPPPPAFLMTHQRRLPMPAFYNPSPIRALPARRTAGVRLASTSRWAILRSPTSRPCLLLDRSRLKLSMPCLDAFPSPSSRTRPLYRGATAKRGQMRSSCFSSSYSKPSTPMYS